MCDTWASLDTNIPNCQDYIMTNLMSSLVVVVVGLVDCSNLAPSHSYSMIIKPQLLGHLRVTYINIRYA